MVRRVTAVILAGGESKRFGSDKAFAAWQGRPFLHWVVKAVEGVSDSFVILVAPGSNNLQYAKEVPGATIIPDRALHQGPVEALWGAKDFLRAETLLVVPCDAPGLPSGLARHLVATSEEHKLPAVAEGPAGPIYTLFAAPRRLLLERLESAKRMQDVLEDAVAVRTDAEGLNVNEPVGR